MRFANPNVPEFRLGNSEKSNWAIMKILVNLLFVALLATGCASEVPIPTTYPATSQQKIKSAHHWNVIAKDAAQQAAASLGKNNLSSTPVAVTMLQPDTTFGVGFRNFLITHLVDLNQPVAQKGADVEVQFETQVVRHASDRAATVPGELTALTAGIMVVRQAALNWGGNAQAGGALALAGLADWGMGYSTRVSRTEVIVTTSVTRNGQFLMRKTDVYYLEDVDGSLYEQMKMWKVVG
jgi:hypothetical protein